MSENWGNDFIPPRASGRLNLVEALSVAKHLPLEAMEEAVRRPQAIAREVLAATERAASGETLTERDKNLLFWGVHALAQARDTRLFGPLLKLLRQPGEAPVELLADVLQTTLPNVVSSLFDGDAVTLEAAIEDAETDEVVRWGLFAAYAFLVFDGRIERERARDLLIRFDENRLARAGDAAWAGWEEAIALLGFREFEPRRRAAIADARLLVEEGEEEGFVALLARADADPSDPSRFAERGLGYIDDAVAELDEALATEEDDAPEEPVQNPLRSVGRNDSCPCGSGKKFKKCCLGKAEAQGAP